MNCPFLKHALSTSEFPSLGYIEPQPILEIGKIKSLREEEVTSDAGGHTSHQWTFYFEFPLDDVRKIHATADKYIGTELLLMVGSQPVCPVVMLEIPEDAWALTLTNETAVHIAEREFAKIPRRND